MDDDLFGGLGDTVKAAPARKATASKPSKDDSLFGDLDDATPATKAPSALSDPFADPFARPKRDAADSKKSDADSKKSDADDALFGGPAALDPFARPKRDKKPSAAAANETVDLFGSADIKSKSAKDVADSLFDF